MLIDDFKNLIQSVKQDMKATMSKEDWWALEKKYLGRKGELNKLMTSLKEVAVEEKKELGSLANSVKNELEVFFNKQKEVFSQVSSNTSNIDLTLPGKAQPLGHLHPITQIQYELEDIFTAMGFIVEDGPELESEYYNFDALNIPISHPARDMQDTFFTAEGNLLRTHTSPVQIRAMEKYGAPLRCVVPGKVFRNEATDASHDHTFHQLEGLMVDKNISITNLIAVMKELLGGIFKREVTVRLRPGFFPFVEPGFELDIKCLICAGQGCSVCKQNGWVELLPCGLVHPHVLRAGGLDPNEWSGFAFGLGLTRLAMMRYGIEDIRLLMGNDVRFLKQF
jgi:phenylalanyl-tRNA synthetase alpha chain